MSRSALKQPSAVLPIAMSLAAMSLVVIQLLTAGTAPQSDEGAAAHLWQLLMAGQLPIVAFFALTVLPGAPRAGLLVLALQATAGLAATLPVFLLRW